MVDTSNVSKFVRRAERTETRTVTNTKTKKRTEKKELDPRTHAEVIGANRAVKQARREYSPIKGKKLEDPKYRREVKSGSTSVKVKVVGNPRIKVQVKEDGRNVWFDRMALSRMARSGQYKVNKKKK